MNLDKSIELDILEDAVEGSPDNLWNVVEFYRYHYPELDQSSCVAAARTLVRGMVDKGWVLIVRATVESGDRLKDPPPTWPEREWEIGSEDELRKYLITATPLGEKVYLAQDTTTRFQ